MIYEDKKEKEYYILECPKCFYRWEQVFDIGTFTTYSVYCDYCYNHLEMSNLEVLKRRLAVFEYTALNRTPVILRDMFNFIMNEIECIRKDKNDYPLC